MPKITLTDVTEDLSGITDKARPHPDDPIMNTDGGVSFRRNRRDCSLEMTVEGPGAAAA